MKIEEKAPTTRSAAVEVEVPGTPEQVWQAIATGPGITSWFVPTDVAERIGGEIVFRLGPGTDSKGVVTGWDPPRRFAYEEKDWSPGAPPLATELVVEARAGGTCVVRLVSSLFTSADDWDDQLEGFKTGWVPFFHVLRLSLTHFPDRHASVAQASGTVSGPEPRAWERFVRALGFAGATVGERRAAPSDGPPLSGTIEQVSSRGVVVRIDAPVPGVALLGVYSWDDRVHLGLTLYLFGAGAPEAAGGVQASWHAWMDAFVAAAD